MKKFNKKYGILGWLLFFSVVALGAKIGDNTLRVGDPSGSDILIQMGDNGQLKWSDADQKLQFSNDAGASIKEIGSGGGGAGGIDLLENSDFESGAPPTNWTASAGTFIAETSNPGFDAQSGSWDAGAASQNLDSDLYSVPLGLESRACNATIQYKYDTGSSGDYKLQVVANTAGLLVEKDLSATTDWVKEAVQFTCPDSDSIRIRITSTLDGGIILVDNATLGKTDFITVSQSELTAYAFYPSTASCTWGRDNASFGSFSADADCPSISVSAGTGEVDTADDDLPNIKLDNLKPGIYTVDAIFTSRHDSTASGVSKGFRLHDGTSAISGDCGYSSANLADGTNDYNIKCSGVFTLTQATASVTVEVQAFEDGTGGVRIDNTDDNENLIFVVKRYPTQSAEAITLETVGEYWDLNIFDTNNVDAGTSAITAYAPISDTDITLEINSGSKSAQIPCTGGNPSTGTTCSSGDEIIGAVIDISTAGLYEACFAWTHEMSPTATGDVYSQYFQVVETANTTDTIIQEGKQRTGQRHQKTATSHVLAWTMNNCGTFVFTSAGQKTLKLMNEINIQSGTISGNTIRMDRDASTGQRDMHVTIRKLDQQMPTPAFTDLTASLTARVRSTLSNARVEFVSFQTSGSDCTIITQSGAFASCARDSAGTYSLTISPVFSGVPSCSIVPWQLASTGFFVGLGSVGASIVQTKHFNASGTLVDNVYGSMVCVGPN